MKGEVKQVSTTLDSTERAYLAQLASRVSEYRDELGEDHPLVEHLIGTAIARDRWIVRTCA